MFTSNGNRGNFRIQMYTHNTEPFQSVLLGKKTCLQATNAMSSREGIVCWAKKRKMSKSGTYKFLRSTFFVNLDSLNKVLSFLFLSKLMKKEEMLWKEDTSHPWVCLSITYPAPIFTRFTCFIFIVWMFCFSLSTQEERLIEYICNRIHLIGLIQTKLQIIRAAVLCDKQQKPRLRDQRRLKETNGTSTRILTNWYY